MKALISHSQAICRSRAKRSGWLRSTTAIKCGQAIARRFSSTRGIRACGLGSDDPEIEDEEQRKDEVRERVRRADGDAAGLYAADKVSKVRELRMLLADGLDRQQAEIKLRRYRKSLAMLEQVIPENSLVQELRFELEALDALPPPKPRRGLLSSLADQPRAAEDGQDAADEQEQTRQDRGPAAL